MWWGVVVYGKSVQTVEVGETNGVFGLTHNAHNGRWHVGVVAWQRGGEYVGIGKLPRWKNEPVERTLVLGARQLVVPMDAVGAGPAQSSECV